LCATQHKICHFGDVPQANLLAWYGKTKPNTRKAHIHPSKEILQRKINRKLKPGLVAFYDIRPGNGAGLFSKEKVSKGVDSKEKKCRKRISLEANDVNKQTIAPKSTYESRADYTLEPTWDMGRM